MHVYIHMAADSCESIMAGQHNPIGKQAAGEAVRGSPLLAVLRQIRRFVPTLPICFVPNTPLLKIVLMVFFIFFNPAPSGLPVRPVEVEGVWEAEMRLRRRAVKGGCEGAGRGPGVCAEKRTLARRDRLV